MNISTRFTVALHVLTLLASKRDEMLTSEFIAGSVNTNPVVVRRILGVLRKAGVVRSQPGIGGGWELAVSPGKLTMALIRRAVDDSSLFAMHTQPPNPNCPVGRCIQKALKPVFSRAEKAMEESLERTTVRDLLRAIEGKS